MSPIHRRTAIGLIAAALGLAALDGCAKADKPLVGGPFHMIDQNRHPVDQSMLDGKWSLVFFGYTFCPDVCPTTLQTLAQAQDRLGPKAAKLQIVFVTIDPGRDTSDKLRTYLASPGFPKGVIGLTGSPAQVDAIAKAYKVYYARQGAGADYAMDHSAAIYLMDPKGRYDRILALGITPEEMARQISDAMRG